MKEHVHVMVSQGTDCPYAQIPSALVWDLVEYLSMQRVRASYDFDSQHFTVAFPTMSKEKAQMLLDEWARADHVMVGGIRG